MPRYSNKIFIDRLYKMYPVDDMPFDDVYNLHWMYIFEKIYKIPKSERSEFNETYHMFRESLRCIREMSKIK